MTPSDEFEPGDGLGLVRDILFCVYVWVFAALLVYAVCRWVR